MKKVITYGTYDLLHEGHVRLLERAKQLGDYLIVGVTSEDFDRKRGKINVKQSLMERIENVKALNIADEIIVEEYEGQKIDDIKRYNIDIFTVGSDWIGKFDYLKELCEVVYLDRTEGISSSDIRGKHRVKLGIVGDGDYLKKVYRESKYVNEVSICALLRDNIENVPVEYDGIECITNNYNEVLDKVDAVYIHSYPQRHYEYIKRALENRVHVLCESPIALEKNQVEELFALARENGCVLMEALRTAYSTAYSRLLLLLKSGAIGDVKMVDATCTSLKDSDYLETEGENWNSICAWGPNAMLPVFQILGTDYKQKYIVSSLLDGNSDIDLFTKVDFLYDNAVASVKIGQGVKSEGDLIISGTKGYVYVPAPWWKTDYFEVRYERAENNRRYFYQLDGEGIRYELVAFCRAVESGTQYSYISKDVSRAFVDVISDFYNRRNFTSI